MRGNKVSSSSADQDQEGVSIFLPTNLKSLWTRSKEFEEAAKTVETKNPFIRTFTSRYRRMLKKIVASEFENETEWRNFRCFLLQFNLIQDARVQVRWICLPLLSSYLSQRSNNWWLCWDFKRLDCYNEQHKQISSHLKWHSKNLGAFIEGSELVVQARSPRDSSKNQ